MGASGGVTFFFLVVVGGEVNKSTKIFFVVFFFCLCCLAGNVDTERSPLFLDFLDDFFLPDDDFVVTGND